MAGIVGIYASIGEHVPWITKREKYHEPVSEAWVNRCHYRATSLLILGRYTQYFLIETSWNFCSHTETDIQTIAHTTCPKYFDI